MADDEVPQNYYIPGDDALGDSPKSEYKQTLDTKTAKKKKGCQPRVDIYKLKASLVYDHLVHLYLKHYPNLSPLEIKRLSKLCFLEQKDKFSLKEVVALCNQHKPLCEVLILASSALRCIEIIKSLCNFKLGFGRASKLFGKHLKVDQQIEYLKKGKFGIAVGTPSRVLTILQTESGLFPHLRFILIDGHRDVKLRSIFDIPETLKPLLLLLFANPDRSLAGKVPTVGFID